MMLSAQSDVYLSCLPACEKTSLIGSVLHKATDCVRSAPVCCKACIAPYSLAVRVLCQPCDKVVYIETVNFLPILLFVYKAMRTQLSLNKELENQLPYRHFFHQETLLCKAQFPDYELWRTCLRRIGDYIQSNEKPRSGAVRGVGFRQVVFVCRADGKGIH